ncbi:ferredoxin--NADP reductase [Sinimarinibacterium thermocellulolyticum]|uniref:Ferredoxin--NADP reductase n=1 Tax=Sinimarinibacterium thermocellulolyticum TaxID=3170016 RepID=A0ABV2AD83_9GAMM
MSVRTAIAASRRRIVLPRPHGPAQRWSLHAPTVPRAVLVVEVRRETEDAVTLVLHPEDGRPIPFRAGQYLTHCFEIDGQAQRRAYSISSAEGQPLACTIKALPDGRVSQHVLRAVRPGTRYSVIGPTGDFVLPDDTRAPLVLLAGGSGITPVISLAETALARDPQRAVRLVYVNRDPARAIFAERLRQLAARHPALQLVQHASAGGRPDAAQLRALLQPSAAAEHYLCGPQGLMDAAEAALRAAGVPAARIHRERFIPAPRPQPRPTTPQPITFTRSGRSVEQQPGESILDAGLRAGIALEYSCTVGGCGHCKVRVLDGTPLLNEPNCLSEAERNAGWTLACSACATGPLTIDA